MSPFTGSNQAINDKKHVGLLDRRRGGREKNKRKEVQENGWAERKRGLRNRQAVDERGRRVTEDERVREKEAISSTLGND